MFYFLDHFFDKHDHKVNARSASTYLSDAGKLLAMLFTLLHLTYGQPARATEMVTIRLRNFGAERRSIFVTNGMNDLSFFEAVIIFQLHHSHIMSYILDGIMLDILYNKTQALTGFGPTILRFPPPLVSSLLFVYLRFVRPVETYFTAALFKSQAQVDSVNFFLFTNGKRWTAEKTRDTFCRISNLNLTWSEFRHVSIAFLRHMSLPENLREYLPIDEQAGHSQATAEKVYGFADSASHTRTDMILIKGEIVIHTLLNRRRKKKRKTKRKNGDDIIMILLHPPH